MSKEIKGVEIFSTGTWNGDKYTEQDLDDMVQAFKENEGNFRPYLKLGHNEDQKLIQQDGLPAAGWIGNIYRKGEKLIADFVDIPQKIYELIQKGAYKKVSSEIYWDIDIKGKKFKKLLSAVALLGADTPAVMNLADILAMYGFNDFNAIKSYATDQNEVTLKQYDYQSKEYEMAEDQKEDKVMEEKKDMKEENDPMADMKEELKALKAKLSEKDAEIEKLSQDKEKYEADAAKAQQEKFTTEQKAYVAELANEKLITPAMRPLVEALLIEDKKEYSFKSDKDEEKKYTKNDLVKEILKLHTATDVNVEESSSEGQKDEGNSDAKLNDKIEKFMEENKVSYKAAYKAVTKEVAPRESEVNED